MTTISITASVSSVLLDDHIIIRWSDGSITIEAPAYLFGDESAEHVLLSQEQARALDDLLSEA